MAAEILILADSLAALVNSCVFSQAFSAVRRARPLYDLAALKTLTVSVVPHGVRSQLSSRTACQYDYELDLAVQKVFTTGADAETDPLFQLVQEISDFVRMKPLAPGPASWIRMENSPLYVPDHWDTKKCFTSVLTHTYRLSR